MEFDELHEGMAVRLRSLPLTVAAVDASGAILEAPGRWAVYRVEPSGAVFNLTGVRPGAGRRRAEAPRPTSLTLADVVPASS